MSAVFILLTLSALVGFALGRSFSCPAMAATSIGVAVLSSVTLQIQGFGAVSGIAVVVVCLTLSQVGYLAADWLSLSDKKTDEKPGDYRDNDVGRGQHEQQKAPAEFT
jgi:hypothetical protein